MTFKNIRFTGDGLPGESVIRGISPETAVRNVMINDLTIDGKRMRSARKAGSAVGDYVDGLIIR